METIYDHGVTEQELMALFGPEDERETREEYFEFLSSDSACADLYRLYRYRRQFARAGGYLVRIADARYRRTVGMPSCRDSLSTQAGGPTASKKSPAASAAT
jgi:hypothetical protein